MRKIKQFFKSFWEYLGELCEPKEETGRINPYGKEEESYPYTRGRKKDVIFSCPFCTYSGSPEEVRVHLLNRHKQK